MTRTARTKTQIDDTPDSKDLRIKIAWPVWEAIEAVSKATRKQPAEILTEAFLMRFDGMARLESAIAAFNEAKQDREALEIIADEIIDAQAARAELDDIRANQ